MSDRFSQPRLAAMAAKGLMLTTVCATASLQLWAPTSLTARAADGWLGDALAVAMLLLAAVGWADILYTDLAGRVILPSLPQRWRHPLCVLLYSLLAGCYLVFAFVAMQPAVPTSWILIVDYVVVAACGGVLAVSIAQEQRT